jgi:uncharacterized membrane protein YbhN (UPF0104 family)
VSRLRIPWPLRLGAGVVLLAAVLLYYDVAAAASALGETRWWLAAPAIAGLVAVHLLGAVAWRTLAVTLTSSELRWGTAIRTFYAAQAIGTITPAGIGSDAYRARATWTDRRTWKRALAPVAVHRAASYLSLALLAAVAALFVPVAGTVRLGLAAIPVLAIVAIGAVVIARWRGRTTGIVVDRAAALATVTAVALMGAFHVIAVGLTCVLVVALQPGVEVATVVAALMVARMATFLPLTPAGIGLQEGAFALLLPEAGVSAEVAVAASALTRLAMMATLVVGAVALASGRDRAKAGRRPSATQALTAHAKSSSPSVADP